jgi:hypothetical protein
MLMNANLPKSTIEKPSEGCPECGGNLIQNGHESVCEICGLVHEFNGYQMTQQSRLTSEYEDAKFTNNWGAPFAIGPKMGVIDPKDKPLFYIHQRTYTGIENRMIAHLKCLKRIVSSLEIPQNIQICIQLRFYRWYKQYYHYHCPGPIMLLAIEYECVDQGIFRYSTIELYRIFKNYALIFPWQKVEKMRHVMDLPNIIQRESRVDHYLSQFLSEFNQPELMDVVNNWRIHLIKFQRHPRVIAATAIYLAAQKFSEFRVSQNRLAEFFGVSPQAIRNTKQILLKLKLN